MNQIADGVERELLKLRTQLAEAASANAKAETKITELRAELSEMKAADRKTITDLPAILPSVRRMQR